MTIDDLIHTLVQYPGHLEVKVLVTTREGIFNDAITANAERALFVEGANGAVWLTGSETDDSGSPQRVITSCHCGIEHEIDTTGPTCELPSRDPQR